MHDHTPLPWKWHPRFEESDRNGSIYSELRSGHAYAVAMQPRYIGNYRWEADASLIVASVNNYDAMVNALKHIAKLTDERGEIGLLSRSVLNLVGEPK